jgi:hypothetical protein
MVVLKQMCADHVCKRMIFFVECEDGRVGCTCDRLDVRSKADRGMRTSVNFLGTFLLVVAEDEEFESIVTISAC